MNEKGVIIVDLSLPIGLQVNISSILGMTLGKARPELIGPTAQNADQLDFEGITRIPIPVLQATEIQLREVHDLGREQSCYLVCFTGAALSTKTYEDYQNLLAQTALEGMRFYGVLLYGDKKAVNKIVGRLPLLK
jgi:hypothetical protein